MPNETILDPVTKTAMPFPWMALGSVVGGAFNYFQQDRQSREMAAVSRENTDKTIAYQKQAADLAYSRNLEQWNRANLYDSPQEQMKRLKAAGLNPNLVYGSGNPAGGSNASPQMSVPSGQYNYQAQMRPTLDFQSMMAGIQDYQMGKAQIRKTKAEAEAAEANAITALVNAMGDQLRIPNLPKENQAKLETILGNALSAITKGRLDEATYQSDLEARKASSSSAKTAASRAARELSELFPTTVESEKIRKDILDLEKTSKGINTQMLKDFGVGEDAPPWLKVLLKNDPGLLKDLLNWLKKFAN